MQLEETLADMIAPNMTISLLGFFDEVQDPYIINTHRSFGIDGTIIQVVYDFVFDVHKHGQRKSIVLSAKATPTDTFYPATGRCAMTGKEFNLDINSIDRVLFNRAPSEKN